MILGDFVLYILFLSIFTFFNIRQLLPADLLREPSSTIAIYKPVTGLIIKPQELRHGFLLRSDIDNTLLRKNPKKVYLAFRRLINKFDNSGGIFNYTP